MIILRCLAAAGADVEADAVDLSVADLSVADLGDRHAGGDRRAGGDRVVARR